MWIARRARSSRLICRGAVEREAQGAGTAGAIARSVLIVDDEDDILELIELTLLRMGLDVDRATTVKAAIEKVQAGNYDLCLTDMRLPDGDGLELVAVHLRQSFPTCRWR